MCVIIAKPAGVALPAENILFAAHQANPHGCGFATPTKIYKSLNYARFRKALSKVNPLDPCIIHFRLATHGSIKAGNCHPFRRGNVMFAHNGILSIEPDGDMTDSETAFQNFIYPAIKTFGLYADETNEIIDYLIGYSKFAIIQGDELRLDGDYQKMPDGCFYSNTRFMPMAWRLSPSKYDRFFDYTAL